MSRIPWRLGERYELVSQLAVSAGCAVWRGRDTVGGTDCAVKVLRPELVADPVAFAQLQRTLSAVAGLGHPGIAAVSETVVHEGWVALVSRFVPGRSLRSLLDEQAPLSPERAAALVSQLCAALAAAHAAGVTHGNLTASQVLLDPTRTVPGDSGPVSDGTVDSALGSTVESTVLTDFGLAALINRTAEQGALPFVPAPRYRAPELRQGDPSTEASDIYGVGVILYEALAGHHPFDISQDGEAVLVRRDVPETIAGLSLPLWHLITGCLAPNPINRPQAATVARLLAGPVPTGPGPSAAPRRTGTRVGGFPAAATIVAADAPTTQVLHTHVRSMPVAACTGPSAPSAFPVPVQDNPTIFMPVIRPDSAPIPAASAAGVGGADAGDGPEEGRRHRASRTRRRVLLSGAGLCAVVLAAVFGFTNLSSGGSRTTSGADIPVVAPNGGNGLLAGGSSATASAHASASASKSASASASASATASASASGGASARPAAGSGTPGGSASASPSPSASVVAPPGGLGSGPVSGTSLANAHSGKCLDTQNGTYASGTPEQQLACGAATGESWALSGGALSQDGGAYCLDDYGFGNSPGARVVLWACNGGTNQQWTVRSDGTIENVFAKLCLDVAGQSASDGAAIQLSACTALSSERWSWQ